MANTVLATKGPGKTVQEIADGNPDMSTLQAFLLSQDTMTYSSYYNGKMSFALAGKRWREQVEKTFENIDGQQTSENIFKDVIDLYISNLMPTPKELHKFSDTLVPLLSRGEAPVLVLSDGTASFPERYEMVSDGDYTVAAIFTRSLLAMEDYVTFADTNGTTWLYKKPVPKDFAQADRMGYKFVEETHGHTLLRFALDDKGMGGSLAALQDRANHSILDQTAIAEMYARPFWYLLNVDMVQANPYLPASAQPDTGGMVERDIDGGGSNLFTTSSEGPFGQLTPPTINDMVDYHNSIISKVSQSTGIPEFYFKPGNGTVPSGTALKVLSRRYNNTVGRIRDSIEDNLRTLATLLGVQKEDDDEELVLWDGTDDLLQEALDAHGESLFRMGYPLEYIAEVVTPGVDLDDYLDDGFAEGEVGPTPDQVAAYAANPGQEAGKPAINPLRPANGQPPTLTPVK